jgi:hypothetical protein
MSDRAMYPMQTVFGTATMSKGTTSIRRSLDRSRSAGFRRPGAVTLAVVSPVMIHVRRMAGRAGGASGRWLTGLGRTGESPSVQ